MSNLNLSLETSWTNLGIVSFDNPDYVRLQPKELPILGSKNCYRITAQTTDDRAINRSWSSAGWVNLYINGAIQESAITIKSTRLLLQRNNLLFTPFIASAYRLEFSMVSYLKDVTYIIDETVEYLNLNPQSQT